MWIPRGILLFRDSARDFFRTKGFLRIIDGFFLKTIEILPKTYKIFGSEMPLDETNIFATNWKVMFASII